MSLISKILSQRFFKEFVVVFVSVWVLNFFALKYDLYWTIHEFDSLVHFLGGAMVGMGFIYGFYSSGIFRPNEVTLWGFIRIAMLGTLFVSVGWEIYELVTGTALIGNDTYAY